MEIVQQAAGIGDEDLPATARAKLGDLFGEDGTADAVDRVASAIGLSDLQFPVEEVYWGTRKLFERLAHHRPLVVVFEDIHWAEAALLDLIARVADTAADTPILLVCVARPELSERRPGWLGRSDAHVLSLEPLSAEQTALVLGNLLGEADLDDEARTAIVAASDGNPLFAEQLLAMLIDDGYLRRENGHWARTREVRMLAVPPTIDALLSARLDLLAREERAVIEPASVVGGVFQVAAVGALVDDPIRPLVSTHLHALEGKQLIKPEQSPPADEDLWFRFHHILIRDAAYQGLLKRRRVALHERFADWLEAVSEERHRNVEYEAIVGYHLEQAHRYLSELGLPDDHGRDLAVRAAARLGSAGRRAFARADMSAAANLLRRAAMLLPVEDPTRLALLPQLAEALMEIGEFPWALLFLDEAADLTVDDLRLEADLALTRLLVRHHVEENLEQWREEVAREAERLIPVLQEQRADAELAKAWRLLGYVHGSVCRFGEAAAAVLQAAEHARRANDPRLEARNVSGLHPGGSLRADAGRGGDRALRAPRHPRPERPAGGGTGPLLAGAATRDAGRLRARPRAGAGGPYPPRRSGRHRSRRVHGDALRGHRTAGRRPADGRGRAAAGRQDPDLARREVPAAAACGGARPGRLRAGQGGRSRGDQPPGRGAVRTGRRGGRRPCGVRSERRCWPAGTSPRRPSDWPGKRSG